MHQNKTTFCTHIRPGEHFDILTFSCTMTRKKIKWYPRQCFNKTLIVYIRPRPRSPSMRLHFTCQHLASGLLFTKMSSYCLNILVVFLGFSPFAGGVWNLCLVINGGSPQLCVQQNKDKIQGFFLWLNRDEIIMISGHTDVPIFFSQRSLLLVSFVFAGVR